MRNEVKTAERRAKFRFPMQRELRFKVLEDGVIIAAGSGETVNLSSTGIGMAIGQQLTIGAFVEISVSWPVLLNATCPMRLIVFGRVLRSDDSLTACSIEKYEFRTQSRGLHIVTQARSDSMLQRWAETVKARTMAVGCAHASAPACS